MSGIAVGADGKARAGMGIDTGDYDGDGRLDLVITNLDFEMHTLNRGLERGLFGYATMESGIGFPTLPFVGFGVAFLDFDNDTQLDIAIANGHILDNAPQFRAGVDVHAAEAAVPEYDDCADSSKSAAWRARHSPPSGSAAGSPSATSTTTATSTCSSPTTARTPSCCATTAGNRANALLVRLRGAGAQHGRDRRADSAHRGIADADSRREGGIQLPESERSARAFRPRHCRARRSDRGAVAVGRMEAVANVAANQIVTIEEGRGIVAGQAFSQTDSGRLLKDAA